MKQQPAEILLVDDDRMARKVFGDVFRDDGFAVRTARNGEEAIAAIAERRPDVVVLDMMMPKMNGIDTCRAVRERDATLPILFLSCVPDDTKKLRAYDSGADDYIEKDINQDVLLAKIRAAVRRTANASVERRRNGVLRLGAVEVDLRSGEVSCPGRSSSRLTRTERDLLKALAEERGRTLSRDELIAAIRGEGFACEDSMLYTHILNLRKKLGQAAGLLTSARGIGYSLLP